MTVLSPITNFIADNPQWIAVFCGALIEYFIGRSQKIKSNSILELLMNIFLRRKL